jgi:hypothetical protein
VGGKPARVDRRMSAFLGRHDLVSGPVWRSVRAGRWQSFLKYRLGTICQCKVSTAWCCSRCRREARKPSRKFWAINIADFAAHFCNYLASVRWHSGIRRSVVMEEIGQWPSTAPACGADVCLSHHVMERRCLLVSQQRTFQHPSATSDKCRYCCKSRKSDNPKNLAKVDLWTSLLLRRFSTPLRRSVIDFG